MSIQQRELLCGLDFSAYNIGSFTKAWPDDDFAYEERNEFDEVMHGERKRDCIDCLGCVITRVFDEFLDYGSDAVTLRDFGGEDMGPLGPI